MTNSDDPRGRQSPDGDAPGHTSDPTSAYGQAGYQPPPYPPVGAPYYPTQQYPTQQYGNYPPDQQYPTQQYPTQQYPTQQYGQYPPDQQYGTQQSPTQQYPTQYGGQGYGEFPPGEPPQKPGGSKTWMWVLGGFVIVALLVGGVLALVGTSSDDTEASAPRTTRTVPSLSPPTSSPALPTLPPIDQIPGLEQLPGGLGEALGDSGSAIGTVRSNDGSTLVIDSIGGSAITVVTNAQTQIISLSGNTVADIAPGSNIVVQGTPIDNGSLTAEIIISTSLGN